MKNIAQVFQLPAKRLADGLMTEADAQYGFATGVGADDVEQESCLGGDARSWYSL